MAVMMKNLDGPGLLQQLGIAQADMDWLVEHKVQVAVTATAVLFQEVGTGFKLFTVPAKLSVVTQLLQGGEPDPIMVQSLVHSVQGAIMNLKKGSVGAMALLKKAPAKPPAKAKGKAKVDEAWPVFDLAELKTALPVKLRDATMMYQPVRGSSPQSRYFMIAANQQLRIAARYKGSSLSLRIEGPGLEECKHQIHQCGFDNVSLEKGYASLHLSVDDHVVAAKALGAVIVGLGVAIETPIPDLSVIKDAGS
jgi:hypothetical protein